MSTHRPSEAYPRPRAVPKSKCREVDTTPTPDNTIGVGGRARVPPRRASRVVADESDARQAYWTRLLGKVATDGACE